MSTVMRRSLRCARAFAPALLALLALPAAAQPSPQGNPEPEIVTIAVAGAGPLGREVAMPIEVFRPGGDGPFPVVLFLHGRASAQAERARRALAIPRGHARYWLTRGFAVVAPIRPGYGGTSGVDPEATGAR
jgi:acetyl esterase/lipase